MGLVRETREDRALSLGVSPRGGIHLFRATQAAAILSGRTYAIPDDLQSVIMPVLSHRILPASGQGAIPGERRRIAKNVLQDLVDRLPVPV